MDPCSLHTPEAVVPVAASFLARNIFMTLSPENLAKAKANVEKINAMSKEQLWQMFQSGECPYEPEHLIGVPLGMFHCEVCGRMIVAGMPHGPIKWIGDFDTGYADFPAQN